MCIGGTEFRSHIFAGDRPAPEMFGDQWTGYIVVSNYILKPKPRWWYGFASPDYGTHRSTDRYTDWHFERKLVEWLKNCFAMLNYIWQGYNETGITRVLSLSLGTLGFTYLYSKVTQRMSTIHRHRCQLAARNSYYSFPKMHRITRTFIIWMADERAIRIHSLVTLLIIIQVLYRVDVRLCKSSCLFFFISLNHLLLATIIGELIMVDDDKALGT